MSEPRQVLPGSTYLVTRRVTERRFFLRPDSAITQAFGYLLAVATRLFSVIVTDRHCRISRFVAYLNRLMALCVNVLRGRDEAVWSSDGPSLVRLESEAAVWDKLLYVLGNAVSSGLLPRAEQWPGFWTSPEQVLDKDGVAFDRPGVYFDPAGRMPKAATLKLTKPPPMAHMTDSEFVHELRRRLRTYERKMRRKVRRSGRSFMTVERLRTQRWDAKPKSRERWRKRDPQIAAPEAEIRVAAIERIQTFRREYRARYRDWCRGRRKVEFPAGTYLMRVVFGVRCANAPPAWPGHPAPA